MSSWTLDRLATTLFFLTIAVAAALSPMTSDTWWQLRAGADMWASGRVLLSDTYSHTAFGAFWPNHEWLSQVIFYGLYRLGGLPLLSLFAAGLVVAGWAVTWQLAGGPAMRRLAILLPALVPASEHWAPRPHAVSLLCLPLAVWLVTKRRYLLLIPLVAFWANCHGGVLLGLVVVVAALTATALRTPKDRTRIGLALLGCVGAVSATPLGASFWVEIPRSLARIHQLPLNEWFAPKLTDVAMLPFWILAAVLVGLLALNWRRLLEPSAQDLSVVCLAAVVLLVPAATAVRSVGPFLMLACPAICGLLPIDALATVTTRERPNRPLVNLALTASAGTLALVAVVCAYHLQIEHLQWTPLPPASLQALHQCPDNLYNRYDEGGFLIWFEPDRRVFLDGRQDPYQPTLVLDQIRAETSGDYASVFAGHHIRCAYLPAASPVAARLSTAGWSALYRDASWVVLTQ
jgi:hypothetical protein